MLITADELKKIERFKSYSDEEITRKLKKIEYAIRSYTNNSFVSKNIRFCAAIKNNTILFSTPFINVNDTLIIQNKFIKDIFNVKEINDTGILVDSNIVDSTNNQIIKVIYPIDVIEGALDVLEWDFKMRNKVGIKSETISRHTVAYYDNDSNNSVNGYPISLFGFLKPYRKART